MIHKSSADVLHKEKSFTHIIMLVSIYNTFHNYNFPTAIYTFL